MGVTRGIPDFTRCVPKTTTPGQPTNFMEADPIYPDRNLQITGVTRDSAGNPLGNCTLYLLDKDCQNPPMGPFYSDANGNYTIPIPVNLSQPQTTTWQIKCYLPGSPDVAGITVNTLAGA